MPISRLFQYLENPLLALTILLAIVGSISLSDWIIEYVKRLSAHYSLDSPSDINDIPASSAQEGGTNTPNNRHSEHPDIWWVDDLGRQRPVWLTEHWARSGDTNAAVRWMRDGNLKAWLDDNRKHPADYLRRDLEFVLSERFYRAQIYETILKTAPIIEFEEYAYFTQISKSRIERSDGELSGVMGYHTVWPAAAESLFEAMRSAKERDTQVHWDLVFRDKVPVFSCNSCPVG